MRIDQIKTREPFSELFPVEDRIIEALRRDMEIRGYDKSQPIVIWDQEGVVVDGHTRLKAAKLAGMEVYQLYKDGNKAQAPAYLALQFPTLRNWESFQANQHFFISPFFSTIELKSCYLFFPHWAELLTVAMFYFCYNLIIK
jgi:hypothetical protein